MRLARIARRRMVGRAIVRTVATTAVIAGTAGAVQHHQQQKYAQQDAAAQQQQYEQQMQQQQMQQQPAPAPSAGSDMMAQLQQLSQMHNAGVLSDQEFAAAKAKLLAA